MTPPGTGQVASTEHSRGQRCHHRADHNDRRIERRPPEFPRDPGPLMCLPGNGATGSGIGQGTECRVGPVRIRMEITLYLEGEPDGPQERAARHHQPEQDKAGGGKFQVEKVSFCRADQLTHPLNGLRLVSRQLRLDTGVGRIVPSGKVRKDVVADGANNVVSPPRRPLQMILLNEAALASARKPTMGSAPGNCSSIESGGLKRSTASDAERPRGGCVGPAKRHRPLWLRKCHLERAAARRRIQLTAIGVRAILRGNVNHGRIYRYESIG